MLEAACFAAGIFPLGTLPSNLYPFSNGTGRAFTASFCFQERTLPNPGLRGVACQDLRECQRQ